jgi:hypothetical protein
MNGRESLLTADPFFHTLALRAARFSYGRARLPIATDSRLDPRIVSGLEEVSMGRVGAVLVVFVLAIGVLAIPAVAQQTSFDVGLSFGLLLIPDAGSMATVGGAFGVSISDSVEFRISYWRASMSFLGITIMSIDVFDAALVLDLAPSSPVGIYVFGGGAYLLAGVLGEGIGGAAITAGLGLRAEPTESVKIYVEYRPLIKYDILHVVQVGASIAF